MEPREAGHLSVLGHDLEYAWFGPELQDAGPAPIIFLHEGLGSVALWRDVPAELAARTGRPAFVYSRQGYGNSDPCILPRQARYMHDEALEILPALLKELGLRRFVLFGHSDGASISLIAAGAGVLDGLAGMVLEAPHVFIEEMNIAAIDLAKRNYKETDLREKLAKYHGTNVDCAFYGWADAWLLDDWTVADWRGHGSAELADAMADVRFGLLTRT